MHLSILDLLYHTKYEVAKGDGMFIDKKSSIFDL